MNNTIKYLYGNTIYLKRKNRKKFLKLGYKQLSTNIFIDSFDRVTIIKSFTKYSNPNEWKFLNITHKIYEKIKDKKITIMILEKESALSIFHKQYNIYVNCLTPTQSLRNRKYNFYRFIINKTTTEENVNFEIYEGFRKVS